ncbi:nuclear transport factor 2 family protein [Streptomyces sp. NPDC012600]|uniref:nuclear transport factor 2 family protein n=1 Tax=Streptomycetaceae TaxID=2062 RepID=UPI001ABFCEB4
MTALPTDALIADRVGIADLFTRFSRLLDERRWEDAHTVFTEDVTAHSPRGGEIHGLDRLIAFVRQSEVEGERTQHLTTDLLAEVEGDRAAVSANSLVYFFRDGQAPHLTSGLRLSGTAVRTPAGWRLRESWTVLAWTRKD